MESPGDLENDVDHLGLLDRLLFFEDFEEVVALGQLEENAEVGVLRENGVYFDHVFMLAFAEGLDFVVNLVPQLLSRQLVGVHDFQGVFLFVVFVNYFEHLSVPTDAQAFLAFE